MPDAGAHGATANLPHRLGEPPPRRVAVFRALQLGDMLCAVPALRALRAALPEARITLLGLPWAESFVERFGHCLTDFIPFPGAPGLPERTPRPGELRAFLAAARERRFDLVLQMHGSGTHSNRLVLSLGAALTAGFCDATDHCPDTHWFIPYPQHEPEVRRMLRLVEHLGIPPRGEELEFPILTRDRHDFVRLAQMARLPDPPYVCVHPGARAPARCWPPERFAAVADALAAQGLRIVLTGSSSEVYLTTTVAHHMRAPSLNLAGQTTLGSLALLLRGAHLLICNDTGISHVAAALRVPSVVIYSASSPQRWVPLDRQRHRAVFHAIGCRPCSHAVCPIGHPCARRVVPDEVTRQALQLLDHYCRE